MIDHVFDVLERVIDRDEKSSSTCSCHFCEKSRNVGSIHLDATINKTTSSIAPQSQECRDDLGNILDEETIISDKIAIATMKNIVYNVQKEEEQQEEESWIHGCVANMNLLLWNNAVCFEDLFNFMYMKVCKENVSTCSINDECPETKVPSIIWLQDQQRLRRHRIQKSINDMRISTILSDDLESILEKDLRNPTNTTSSTMASEASLRQYDYDEHTYLTVEQTVSSLSSPSFPDINLSFESINSSYYNDHVDLLVLKVDERNPSDEQRKYVTNKHKSNTCTSNSSVRDQSSHHDIRTMNKSEENIHSSAAESNSYHDDINDFMDSFVSYEGTFDITEGISYDDEKQRLAPNLEELCTEESEQSIMSYDTECLAN